MIRLISTLNFECRDFENHPPPYAILSHTWSEKEKSNPELFGAVAFDRNALPAQQAGYHKVKASCERAREFGFNYIWIDLWCIDRTSISGLSSGLNEMFRYYQDSSLCLVYLNDIDFDPVTFNGSQLEKCQWFTRGWTLLELLAPSSVVFYDRSWEKIGTKISLGNTIVAITGIPFDALSNKCSLESFSIAQRMSWAAHRETTLDEDMAYCLMGIFGVNMSIIYGEGGQEAFMRLQAKIIQQSNDQTIFAWTAEPSLARGLLAATPKAFQNSGDIVVDSTYQIQKPFRVTNHGLHVYLNCSDEKNGEMVGLLGCAQNDKLLGVYLSRFATHYERIRPYELLKGPFLPLPTHGREMYIKSSKNVTHNSPEKSQSLHKQNIVYKVYLSSNSSDSAVIWKDNKNTVKSAEYVIPLSKNRHLPVQVVIGQEQKDGSKLALFSVLVQAFDPGPRVGVDIRTNVLQNELHLTHSATSHAQKVFKGCMVTVVARRQMSEEINFTADYEIEIDVRPFSSPLKKQALLSTYRL
ncbi:hypothetical protein GYMLUDRAFT_80517 [Collybiopsis luxurians FD-317 M1]|nr:hypothetical protein GYMLUDRAFT_80517 [Collybiopsis luxurians FD-317 M1]